MAFSMATVYISFSLLICGFYIRIRDMTLSVVRGLTWVSFSKYTFQALAKTELQGRVWEDTTCQPLTAGALSNTSSVVCSLCVLFTICVNRTLDGTLSAEQGCILGLYT